MDTFFELLNAGDREAAVQLMAENAEMRIHVGDSAQTLRGVERVGGWFLRGDAGLRMIPGDVRDTGNTYEADVLVVRPGAPSLHLDATFRVEAGKITSINLAPALAGPRVPRRPAASRSASGERPVDRHEPLRRGLICQSPSGCRSADGHDLLTDDGRLILQPGCHLRERQATGARGTA